MVSSLKFYIDNGFYESLKDLSTEKLLDSILRWRCAYLLDQTITEAAIVSNPRTWIYKREFSPIHQNAEIHLVRYDKNRVWWEQYEYDIIEGNQGYVKLLTEWSKISRGAFSPSEISEDWKSENGPLEVSFLLNKKKKALKPEVQNDWLDANIIKNINEMIKETGFQFYIYELTDSTLFVICLTKEEKKKLEDEKHWTFATL